MSQPKFSIVVCCWNSADYIADCIRSIETQTYKDFEVVFVDGGSSDGTIDLIEMADCRKKILNNVRGGISKAMNAGAHAASGTYLSHLHADDYYADSDVLLRVAKEFERNEDAIWLYGRFYNLQDGVVSAPSYSFRRYSLAGLRRRNIVPHCATFLRRDIFSQFGGFSEEYRLAMDYDLWLRLSKYHDPIQLNSYLGVFRRHSESSTTKFAKQSFNEDFRARFSNTPIYLWPEFVLRYIYRRVREVR